MFGTTTKTYRSPSNYAIELEAGMPGLFEEPLQQEGEEIWECVKLAAPSDILVPELDAVGDIWISQYSLFGPRTILAFPIVTVYINKETRTSREAPDCRGHILCRL